MAAVVVSTSSRTRGVTVCLLEARSVLTGFRKRRFKPSSNAIDADANYLASIWQSLPPALEGDVCFSVMVLVLFGVMLPTQPFPVYF